MLLKVYVNFHHLLVLARQSQKYSFLIQIGVSVIVQLLHYKIMPTLTKFGNCVLTTYAGDHPPPHFHIRTNDGGEALVEIASLEILRGRLPRRQVAEAMDWAAMNQDFLMQTWKNLNS